MWPFRRKRQETLNEQVLREAGLDDQARPLDPLAGSYPAEPNEIGALTGAARPSLGDVVATAHAPGLDGSRVSFVALPSGDLIVEDETGDTDLSPFADLVEREVKPPYRAEANRLQGDEWAVAASAIHVEQFAYEGADALDLVSRGGVTELSADGNPVAGTVPELAAAAVSTDYAVHAERIDGDFWEVRTAAL